MNSTNESNRRVAVKSAIAISALSNFTPSPYGISIYEKWISGIDTERLSFFSKNIIKSFRKNRRLPATGKHAEICLV